jgi:hypothetical protein
VGELAAAAGERADRPLDGDYRFSLQGVMGYVRSLHRKAV